MDPVQSLPVHFAIWILLIGVYKTARLSILLAFTIVLCFYNQ